MVAVREITWEEASSPDFGAGSQSTPDLEAITRPEREAFRAAVAAVADRAKATFPASHTRIDKAVNIVLAGDVTLFDDGTARVGSQCSGTTQYRVVNGSCDCKDVPQAPQGWCKHRLGAAIARRVQELQTPQTGKEIIVRHQAGPAKAMTIPREYLTTIHGKEFVQFTGLLALAHAQGLISLSAELVSVTKDLALAKATATFADGRTFTEAADATPDNVNTGVKKHFARCALTRAKARALRDALNISACAVEELD